MKSFILLLLIAFAAHAQAETPRERLVACLDKIAELSVDRVEADFPGHKYEADVPNLSSQEGDKFWFTVLVHETGLPEGQERGAFLTTEVDRECAIVNGPSPEM